MALMTLDLPETVYSKLQAVEPYLPTILQLQTMQFKTSAKQAAQQVADFLYTGPRESEVVHFKLSGSVDGHMRWLLAENRERSLTEDENRWLDEIEQVAHIVTMLKIKLAAMSD